MDTAIDLSDRDIRQRDLIPPDKLAEMHAVVIGVGAIGRQAAIQLASIGVSTMTLIDHDTVGVENLATQAYMPVDLDSKKVEATSGLVQQINPDVEIHAINDRFKKSVVLDLTGGGKKLAIFCCVDSIDTRRFIFEQTKSYAAFFVDARMSAEVFRVLSVPQPLLEAHYQTTLFSAEEAFRGSCTAKSTVYTASIAAGFMLAQFTRWLRGLPLENDVLFNLASMELVVGNG